MVSSPPFPSFRTLHPNCCSDGSVGRAWQHHLWKRRRVVQRAGWGDVLWADRDQHLPPRASKVQRHRLARRRHHLRGKLDIVAGESAQPVGAERQHPPRRQLVGRRHQPGHWWAMRCCRWKRRHLALQVPGRAAALARPRRRLPGQRQCDVRGRGRRCFVLVVR